MSERSGMIFWAYDLGEYEMAKEFVAVYLEIVNSSDI